ncbi:hypothetical protein GCM10007913_16610 [Devosia yakushimensis]|uniref:Uncharacterized protein n=1 Tax=Devosia yakushimensis TaxID=470028 RepID=A0ABQ5UF01_9HYPH|nr:hypothetical protein GCM10007913_16610 [Devosia yakushimensis]
MFVLSFEVRFAVVENSRAPVSVEDVEAEARRRLRYLKLDEWRTREFITGRPMPEVIQHLVQQIDLASRALSRMSPIPHDYFDDVYWPRMWEVEFGPI